MTEAALATLPPLSADAPEATLVAAFQRIAATRMADMPFCNPVLAVEAVAFRDWQDARVGVLVTPWAVNLVALARPGGVLPRLPLDRFQTWAFPSGAYEFMGGEEPECGIYQFCSLFSPAFEFEDQTAAVDTAKAILDELFRSETDQVAIEAKATEERERAQMAGKAAPLTRRGFLLGGRGA
ncbi:MAG: [NiFe]-hydrogenase assembly, chaperone, HybE [Rhodocyclaceae bacterium]|nr:MAG: [NiFe]-hydrogenase assembly, chaperone, HybE [Rhodocyclaceae bacterium]